MIRAIRFLVLLFLLTALALGRLMFQETPSSRLTFKDMAFKPGVRLGEPVTETCTVRCHIDYPFAEGKVFKHETHSPELGFPCQLCHDPDPLPSPKHGAYKLQRAECRKCHHDAQRFPSCNLCHLPLNRKTERQGMVFDHEKHAQSEKGLQCVVCHTGSVNLKKAAESLDCLMCHHAKPPPVKCVTCHETALESRQSERIEGFDHGHHTGSAHLKDACHICHLSGPKLTALPEISCSACHHPVNPSISLDCGICHRSGDILVQGRNPKFDHDLHVQTGYPCLECHGLDPLRSPAAGYDCGRCHHRQRDGCRLCHEEPLYFVKTYRTGDSTVAFLHAAHEKKNNCRQCHPAGGNIRRGSRALECADCHHHGGSGLACGTCHPKIDRIRSGHLPSGAEGEAEVMYGIVSCRDCHFVNPAEPHSLDAGSRSCLRCHPEEYLDLLADMRRALEKALGEIEGMDAPPYSLEQGIHNFRLTLSDLRRRAAEGRSR